MKRLLKRVVMFFVFAILLNGTATTDTAYGFEQLKIAYQNGNVVDRIFLQTGESEDLCFLGAPSNWASLHPTWNSYDEKIATVDSCGIVTAENVGWTIVCLRLDNGVFGVVFVYVTESVPESSEETEATVDGTVDKTAESTVTPETEPEEKQTIEEKQKEKEEKTVEVILNNQEIIRVPSNAEFTNGTPVVNMIDIARYAFSYTTATGDFIVPTYEADKYGIAEIADVDYSAIKGPKTVIVKNVYFKVYLDLNKDGIISSEEKTSDTAAFYYIRVVVDRTIIVEDWNMVQ